MLFLLTLNQLFSLFLNQFTSLIFMILAGKMSLIAPKDVDPSAVCSSETRISSATIMKEFSHLNDDH